MSSPGSQKAPRRRLARAEKAPSRRRSARRWFGKGSFGFSSGRPVPGSGAEPGTGAPPARTCRRRAGTTTPTLRDRERAEMRPAPGKGRGAAVQRGIPSPGAGTHCSWGSPAGPQRGAGRVPGGTAALPAGQSSRPGAGSTCGGREPALAGNVAPAAPAPPDTAPHPPALDRFSALPVPTPSRCLPVQALPHPGCGTGPPCPRCHPTGQGPTLLTPAWNWG